MLNSALCKISTLRGSLQLCMKLAQGGYSKASMAGLAKYKKDLLVRATRCDFGEYRLTREVWWECMAISSEVKAS